MNKQEYEQKRAELWYEYTAMLRRNCASRYVFDKIFDRVYALGKQDKDAEDTVTIDKEEYDKLCKYRRYVANWYWDFTTCPECGEYNPRGYICINCDNDENWNK